MDEHIMEIFFEIHTGLPRQGPRPAGKLFPCRPADPENPAFPISGAALECRPCT